MKRHWKKFTATVSIAVLCAISISLYTGWAAQGADSISSLQNQYAQLEKRQQQIQKEISKLQDEQDKQQQYQDALNEQIENTQAQIDITNQKLYTLSQNISSLEQQVAEKEQQIQESDALFKKRLRAMYINNQQSNLSFVLSADSFGEFLSRTQIVKSVAEHDRELIEQLKADKKEIMEKKAVIESDKAEVEASKAQIDSKQKQLDAQYEKSNAVVKSLQQNEADKEAENAKLEKQLRELNQSIQEAIRAAEEAAKNNSNSSYVGGEFLWPLPGYTYISSYFGDRVIQGKDDRHTGIDITGGNVYGKSIVAANDGVVVFVKNQTTGYGRHLMIDHGGGTFTLYAHTSYIAVSPGQSVKKGQVIANVGSTGWSTGPHLHFEIWKNAKQVNPLNYFGK